MFLVDATVGVRRDWLELSLDAFNLLDARYADTEYAFVSNWQSSAVPSRVPGAPHHRGSAARAPREPDALPMKHRVTLARSFVVACVLALAGCIEASQEPVDYDAVAVARERRHRARATAGSITLSRADVALGPFYFCAAASGSSTLCASSIAEVTSVSVVNALAPARFAHRPGARLLRKHPERVVRLRHLLVRHADGGDARAVSAGRALDASRGRGAQGNDARPVHGRRRRRAAISGSERDLDGTGDGDGRVQRDAPRGRPGSGRVDEAGRLRRDRREGRRRRARSCSRSSRARRSTARCSSGIKNLAPPELRWVAAP